MPRRRRITQSSRLRFSARLAGLDGEHEHLAQRRGDGRASPLDARRQVAHDARQALADLLAAQ
jgi:hypothetical protein